MGVLAIDWSGAKQPGRKIWIGEARGGSLRRLEPLPSRERAVDQIIQQLGSDAKTIVGLDFAFSMPAWFLRNHHLSSAPELWAMAAQEGEQWLKDCDPPFWGRPGKRKPELETHYRRTERLITPINGIAPKSCFQIGGAGAVGTGSVRGMPFLARLREAGFAIWPFDPPRLPMAVEIYPRILTGAVVKSSPADRADYLSRHWQDLPPELERRAADCDDAFDAAVSGLVMSRYLAEFETLPALDEVAQLEGQIWKPDSVPVASRDVAADDTEGTPSVGARPQPNRNRKAR